MGEARLPGRELTVPALGALLLALLVLYAIGFDQGALASPVTHALSERGGVLHEFFHDARHLLGVPCH
ncbi:MAG: CbtB domain-containing protein [Egibacteraceae bacterium]